MVMYKQCKISRSKIEMYSWIPSEFAKKNKILKIKMGKKWENGWKVEEVYHKELDEKLVKCLSDVYKKQREVSNV